MLNNLLQINNKYEIFKLFNPNDNTKLTEIKNDDLLELIILIDDINIELRNSLGFSKDITFGFEIEFEQTNTQKVKTLINKFFPNSDWKCDYDDSLLDGVEIISPILNDTNSTWRDLKNVCQIGKENGKVSQNSGAHVHVGAHIFNAQKDSFLNFIKLWSIYENIIFRFSYGEFLTPRMSINKYAEPVSFNMYELYKNILNVKTDTDLLYNLPKTRNHAVSFQNTNNLTIFEEKNTIEFRCPNGTLEPAIWQNNANLFISLLKYSIDGNFNDDIVEKRRRILDFECQPSLKIYDDIYFEQALELCDLIFKRNIDKIYFLRQYLKSLDPITKKFEKAKKFVLM